MIIFRFIFRAIFTPFFVLLFAVCSGLVNVVFCFSPFFRRVLISHITSLCSKAILWTLNIKTEVEGELPPPGALVVGNHMSYIDILIFISHFKTLFVTSVDMKHRLFLGQITMLGGCLYVERRNPQNLKNELKNLKRFFEKGLTVCIFPEGTSSDGKEVLPFKKSLFQIALETGCPVKPVVLNYMTVEGKAFSRENHDKLCWYNGGKAFGPHILGLFSMKSAKAKLTLLKTVDSNGFNDRKELCDKTFSMISKVYVSNLSASQNEIMLNN